MCQGLTCPAIIMELKQILIWSALWGCHACLAHALMERIKQLPG